MDSQVDYLARGAGYAVYLTNQQAVLRLEQSAAGATGATLCMRLENGNPLARASGLDELAGKTNYFIGNYPAQWHMQVANYDKVKYADVYPGIDLIYYGNQQQLEFDFVVAAGADPSRIRLDFQGADKLEVDGQGNLVVHTAGGNVVDHAPTVYQTTSQGRASISGSWVVVGAHQAAFRLGAYDVGRELVIDPVLSYSTYVGGSNGDISHAIAVDNAGNAYLAGQTLSTDFPLRDPYQGSLTAAAQEYNAFVTALKPDGSLLYSTYLGGTTNDVATGIAVDLVHGNAYVTGYTTSKDFPLAHAYQGALGGANAQNAFVAELTFNAASSSLSLTYSTYLGGSSIDNANGIAVDPAGEAYISREKRSPATSRLPAPPTKGPLAANVMALCRNFSSIPRPRRCT
jgi:hypothetical protein